MSVKSRKQGRTRDWELLLARVRTLGFTVHDEGHDLVEVERDGRRSHVTIGDMIGTAGATHETCGCFDRPRGRATLGGPFAPPNPVGANDLRPRSHYDGWPGRQGTSSSRWPRDDRVADGR